MQSSCDLLITTTNQLRRSLPCHSLSPSFLKPGITEVVLTRWFGANRPNGRKHAGCDLLAPVGTDIFAIDDGTVYDFNPNFYLETGMIAIRHASGFIARYCEVQRDSIARWQRGMPVQSGEVIAKVGKLTRSSMLHFELYTGKANGPLSNRRNPPFQRRSDLLNPTGLLDSLKRELNVSWGNVVNPTTTSQSII